MHGRHALIVTVPKYSIIILLMISIWIISFFVNMLLWTFLYKAPGYIRKGFSRTLLLEGSVKEQLFNFQLSVTALLCMSTTLY